MLDIRQALHNTLVYSLAQLKNQVVIGESHQMKHTTLDRSVSITGAFSIAFWLRTDGSVHHGGSGQVPLILLRDAIGNSLMIVLLKANPCAVLEKGNSRSTVPICQSFESNVWTHFTLVFPNGDLSRISTFLNAEKLGDSQFVPVNLRGPIQVSLGGLAESMEMPGECARIAQVFVLKYACSPHDVKRLVHENGGLKNCFFSSAEKMTDDHWTETSLANAFQNDSIIRKLFQSFIESKDKILLDVVSRFMPRSKDKLLPLELAAKLGRSSVQLYHCFFALVLQLENDEMQLIWFEEILIHRNLWGWDNAQIFHHWGTVLFDSFRTFFAAKSYFPYFLAHIVEATIGSTILLTRIAQLKFTLADANCLLSKLFSVHEYPAKACMYLSIVRDMAAEIARFNIVTIESLYPFLCSDELDVLVAAIECIYKLAPADFYLRITTIGRYVSIPAAVFEKIKRQFKFMPGLFALACALVVFDTSCILSEFPPLLPHGPLWFFFPLLLYLPSECFSYRSDVTATDRVLWWKIHRREFVTKAETDLRHDQHAEIAAGSRTIFLF
jgi:hypothetical protein